MIRWIEIGRFFFGTAYMAIYIYIAADMVRCFSVVDPIVIPRPRWTYTPKFYQNIENIIFRQCSHFLLFCRNITYSVILQVSKCLIKDSNFETKWIWYTNPY